MLCSLCKGSHPLWARAIPKSSRSSRRVFEVGEGSTREPPPRPRAKRQGSKGRVEGQGQGRGRAGTGPRRARVRAHALTRASSLASPPTHTPWVPGG